MDSLTSVAVLPRDACPGTQRAAAASDELRQTLHLCATLVLLQAFVQRLIWFGGVWYSHVLPKPKDTSTLTQAQLQHWEEVRRPGILKWGSRVRAGELR